MDHSTIQLKFQQENLQHFEVAYMAFMYSFSIIDYQLTVTLPVNPRFKVQLCQKQIAQTNMYINKKKEIVFLFRFSSIHIYE